MANIQPSGRAQAEIPYALLEYTQLFEKPIIEGLSNPISVIAPILSALGPWGFTSDGIEAKTRSEKLSEYAFVFHRTVPANPRLSLTLGLNKVVIVAENPDWAGAESLIAGMRAGLEAILGKTGASPKSQQITLAMHVQIKDKLRQDVTTPLLSQTAFRLLDGDVQFPGIILLRDKASLVIDASLAYANALFVRIVREHRSDAPLEELAVILHKDEEQVFEVLGLEGTL